MNVRISIPALNNTPSATSKPELQPSTAGTDFKDTFATASGIAVKRSPDKSDAKEGPEKKSSKDKSSALESSTVASQPANTVTQMLSLNLSLGLPVVAAKPSDPVPSPTDNFPVTDVAADFTSAISASPAVATSPDPAASPAVAASSTTAASPAVAAGIVTAPAPSDTPSPDAVSPLPAATVSGLKAQLAATIPQLSAASPATKGDAQPVDSKVAEMAAATPDDSQAAKQASTPSAPGDSTVASSTPAPTPAPVAAFMQMALVPLPVSAAPAATIPAPVTVSAAVQNSKASTPAQAATTSSPAPSASQSTAIVATATAPPIPATPSAPTFQFAATKDNSSKQGDVTTKSTGDAHDKRKDDDDSDDSSSTPTTDASVAIKSVDAVTHTAKDASTTTSGNEGFALQQAMQVAVPSAKAADPAAPAAQSTDTSAPAQASSTPTPSTGSDVQAMSSISSAQLIQSVHQSEMRLGMHSTEFGSISINTSLSHQTLSAQISTDHSELTRALAVHLPAIEEKLGSAYGVQARVELRDSSMSSTTGDSAQQSSGGKQGERSSGSSTGSNYVAGSLAALASTSTSSVADSTRLDIRI